MNTLKIKHKAANIIKAILFTEKIFMKLFKSKFDNIVQNSTIDIIKNIVLIRMLIIFDTLFFLKFDKIYPDIQKVCFFKHVNY